MLFPRFLLETYTHALAHTNCDNFGIILNDFQNSTNSVIQIKNPKGEKIPKVPEFNQVMFPRFGFSQDLPNKISIF